MSGQGEGSGGADSNAATKKDPKTTTALEQRKEYKELGYLKQTVDETWYCLAAKWYNSWLEYTAFKKEDADIVGGVESLDTDNNVPRPGPIDDSDLADGENPEALKKELQENLTHVWVHQKQWELFQSWYGGGPAFPRKILERQGKYTSEKYINVYPKFIKFVTCNDDGTFDDTQTTTKTYPMEFSLKSVAEALEKELPKGEGESTATTANEPLVHLWMKFKYIKKIYPIRAKKSTVTDDDLKDQDGERWVEIPDDYLVTKLDDIGLDNDCIIMIEPRITDSEKSTAFKWPRAKSGDDWKNVQVGDILDCQDDQMKWYEAFIRLVGKDGDNKDKIVVHYIGWATKWDEWIPKDDPNRCLKRHTKTVKPHRKRKAQSYAGGYSSNNTSSSWSFYDNESGSPSVNGIIGLRNLGNTCFMNSTIQCIAQSPWLTEYFLSGNFQHHVNKDNPLGWKGKVAEAWAHLLSDMFSQKYRTIAPREFKNAIGEVAPRFMGYAQQDSQELLSFLLDGLHEDLNQIKKKPATEAVESKGRPDTVVAAESWKTYLTRNQSRVVDLMQGQYKSMVDCPDCDRVSITFDPYMFLSVPLPAEKFKVMEFSYIGADTSKPPTVYGLKMFKMGDVDMFKKKVSTLLDVPKDELFVCDVWKSKIHRELRNRESVDGINRRNDDIFVFHSPKPPKPANADQLDEKEAAEANEPVPGEAPANPGANPVPGDAPAGAVPGEANPAPGEEVQEEEVYQQGGQGAAGAARPGAAAAAGEGARAAAGGARQGNQPDYQTFVIQSQVRVQVKTNYMYQQHAREEDQPIGAPLLVTFYMKRDVTHSAARERIFEIVKPFLVDDSLTLDKPLPFQIYAAYGYNNVLKIEDKDDVLPLTERSFKFILHFTDRKAYKEEWYDRQKRPRDQSAPPPIDPTKYQDRGNDKPIPLEACLDAFVEEEILEESDAWYCSKCGDFKCAKKQIQLWSVPDLLIIHLKRFSYTRAWRDRINTLVEFPIEGLDLSNYVLAPDHKQNCIYDLYGVSNHMGGMGGGHYTAYAKSLETQKWYHLDDSRTSEVGNINGIVSSSAYVLYYKRRNPRQMKHRASKVEIPEFVRRRSLEEK